MVIAVKNTRPIMAEHTSAIARAASVRRPVTIKVGDGAIAGDLSTFPDARGIVIFAHGSGSSRHSPRNRAVADVLGKAKLATLLVDLLTEPEERLDNVTAELRFDIPFLSHRLAGAIDWATRE